MKHFFLSLCLLLASTTAWAQLPSVSDFNLDPGNVFQHLDALEQSLDVVPEGLTQEQWFAQVAAAMPDSVAGEYRDPLFNLPLFTFAAVAGCGGSCIGLGFASGLAAVIIVNQDADPAIRRDETRKAWLGCAAGNAPYFLFVGAYIAVIVAANNGDF